MRYTRYATIDEETCILDQLNHCPMLACGSSLAPTSGAHMPSQPSSSNPPAPATLQHACDDGRVVSCHLFDAMCSENTLQRQCLAPPQKPDQIDPCECALYVSDKIRAIGIRDGVCYMNPPSGVAVMDAKSVRQCQTQWADQLGPRDHRLAA